MDPSTLGEIRRRGFPHATGRVPPETLERWSGQGFSGRDMVAMATATSPGLPDSVAFVSFSSPVMSETATPPAPTTPAPPAPAPVAAAPPVTVVTPTPPPPTSSTPDPNYYEFMGKVTEAERTPSVIDRVSRFRSLLAGVNGTVQPMDMLDEKKPVSKAIRQMAAAVTEFDEKSKKGADAILSSGLMSQPSLLAWDTIRKSARDQPDDELLRVTDGILAAAALQQAETHLVVRCCVWPFRRTKPTAGGAEDTGGHRAQGRDGRAQGPNGCGHEALRRE